MCGTVIVICVIRHNRVQDTWFLSVPCTVCLSILPPLFSTLPPISRSHNLLHKPNVKCVITIGPGCVLIQREISPFCSDARELKLKLFKIIIPDWNLFMCQTNASRQSSEDGRSQPMSVSPQNVGKVDGRRRGQSDSSSICVIIHKSSRYMTERFLSFPCTVCLSPPPSISRSRDTHTNNQNVNLTSTSANCPYKDEGKITLFRGKLMSMIYSGKVTLIGWRDVQWWCLRG